MSKALEQEQTVLNMCEDDIREALRSFVKGMNEQERNRFLGIYHKY